jgi:hypothetical protein
METFKFCDPTDRVNQPIIIIMEIDFFWVELEEISYSSYVFFAVVDWSM